MSTDVTSVTAVDYEVGLPSNLASVGRAADRYLKRREAQLLSTDMSGVRFIPRADIERMTNDEISSGTGQDATTDPTKGPGSSDQATADAESAAPFTPPQEILGGEVPAAVPVPEVENANLANLPEKEERDGIELGVRGCEEAGGGRLEVLGPGTESGERLGGVGPGSEGPVEAAAPGRSGRRAQKVPQPGRRRIKRRARRTRPKSTGFVLTNEVVLRYLGLA